jgi:histone H3/H4
LAGIGALAVKSVMYELSVMAERWLHAALQVASACSSKDVWITTMSVLTALDAGVSRCSVVGVVGTEPVDTLAERLEERMPVNLNTGTDKVPLGLIHKRILDGQRQTGFCIPKRVFQAKVLYILAHRLGDRRQISRRALESLQLALENDLKALMEEAHFLSIHGNSIAIIAADVRGAAAVSMTSFPFSSRQLQLANTISVCDSMDCMANEGADLTPISDSPRMRLATVSDRIIDGDYILASKYFDMVAFVKNDLPKCQKFLSFDMTNRAAETSKVHLSQLDSIQESHDVILVKPTLESARKVEKIKPEDEAKSPRDGLFSDCEPNLPAALRSLQLIETAYEPVSIVKVAVYPPEFAALVQNCISAQAPWSNDISSVSLHALTAMQLVVEAKMCQLFEVAEHCNASNRGMYTDIFHRFPSELGVLPYNKPEHAMDLAAFLLANPIWDARDLRPRDIQLARRLLNERC